MSTEDLLQTPRGAEERFLKLSEQDYMNQYLQKIHDRYLPNFLKVVIILLFLLSILVIGGIVTYSLLLDEYIQVSPEYSWLALFLPLLITTGILTIFCCVSSCCWVYLPGPIRHYYRKREENKKNSIFNAPIFFSRFSFYHLLVTAWFQFSWIPVIIIVIALKTVWLPVEVYWTYLIIPLALIALISNIYGYFESFLTLFDKPRIMKNTYICLLINFFQTLLLISVVFSFFMIFAKLDNFMTFPWVVVFIPISFSMFLFLGFVVMFVIASLFYLQDEYTYTECECSVTAFCIYFVMFTLSFLGGSVWSLFWVLLSLKLDTVLPTLDYIVISIPLIVLFLSMPIAVIFMLIFYLYDKNLFSWLRQPIY